MKTNIIQQYNHLLQQSIDNGLQYLIIDKIGELKYSIRGEVYTYKINFNDFEDALPTPILFNGSKKEFILMKDHDRNRDMQDFYTLHEFATLLGSITFLNGVLYITCAMPVLNLLKDDPDVKEHTATEHMSTIRTLIQINPEFEKHPNILKRRARVKMLSDINPVESIADLEKQVDFLTKVVSALVDEDTKKVLESFLVDSSYSYKSEEDVIGDVLNRKAQLRDAMKPYLEVKRLQ